MMSTMLQSQEYDALIKCTNDKIPGVLKDFDMTELPQGLKVCSEDTAESDMAAEMWVLEAGRLCRKK